MIRVSVNVDEELIEAACEVLGARTRAEAVRLALVAAVRRRRLVQATSHRGAVELAANQERLAELRAEG